MSTTNWSGRTVVYNDPFGTSKQVSEEERKSLIDDFYNNTEELNQTNGSGEG
jgi:hypothetical protein